MRAFKELYNVEDLKLNLKFEVEVLSKSLGLKLDAIEPANFLKNRLKPSLIDNSDFNAKAIERAIQEEREMRKTLPQGQRMPLLQQQPPRPHLSSHRRACPTMRTGLQWERRNDCHTQSCILCHIDAQLPLFAANPQYMHVVPIAVDHAIREIIQPVVERSVTIACITAKDIILKDFASGARE